LTGLSGRERKVPSFSFILFFCAGATVVSIMKMVLFFFVSTALHAAALAYPALFLDSRAAAPVIVTVLEEAGGNGIGESGRPSAVPKKPMHATQKSAPEPRREQPGAKAEPAVAEPAQAVELPQTVPEPFVPQEVPGAIVIAARQGDITGAAEKFSPSGGSGANAIRASGSGGAGNASGGTGGNSFGNGSGNREGDGRGNAGARSANVSYDYCPKVEHPEVARREGQEGTVRLKVLVDKDGKPKSLEVSRSSGFPLLDQAAVDTVKGCRFHPAWSGGQRVERWVPVPIEFTLRDQNK
jgi:TonB family protein